jgi:hypothetical protein
MSFSPG